MNVLLVSQCDKRALVETRRVLDQFAERRGDRTWQTAITEAGLLTLRKLLRKTARKNTSVACHWIRGRDHTELLWIVGNASRFNAEGAVPTNTTERNILRRDDENDWHTAEEVRLLAQLGALLHDFGKASVAFQQRLEGKRTERNLYRHEWVSLRLFLAFVGKGDDASWLTRLADAEHCQPDEWTAVGRYHRDGLDVDVDQYPFRSLLEHAPLAAAVGWLVVTHHRLPVAPPQNVEGKKIWWGKRVDRFESSWLNTPLASVAHDWNELPRVVPREQAEPYWQLAGALPVLDADWRKQAARVARRLLERRQRQSADHWLHNAYVMHLARLCLMLADHDYSRLSVGPDDRPAPPRAAFVREGQALFANTRRDRYGTSVLNQSLLEHLLGVGQAAGQIAHALPGFERYLPRLAQHRGLRKRSGNAKFVWQDKAFDAALGMREAAFEQGAFIVNMASTGCGKTLGNARILYALADPQRGMRASYALGLRTLTLQTGRSYRRDLHLSEDELAVLVGGSASRALFEYYEEQATTTGSASAQSLIEEDSHVLYEGDVADHPLLSRALADPDIRRLVSAPMLVCTVDHLVPATESLRAGRQIAPMLRLLSADLVLDELDDYDLDDLPALTRLVYWAGMLGSRVVLSSATLPPALVQGMFLAYRAGRRQFLRNRGTSPTDSPRLAIPCLWVDEFSVQTQTCGGADEGSDFAEAHHGFVERRVGRLRAPQVEPLRRAELCRLESGTRDRQQLRAGFAAQVRDACLRLHSDHADIEPVSGKRVSFGIVRMANIDPLMDVACELYRLGAPAGTHIHLCVYHARFPLAQRSAIEHLLDTVFDRREDEGCAVYRLPSIRAVLDAQEQREVQDHLFVVLASPVCEVGRDWDADWAVAEPSSMRALIQLAGRVQRHRRRPPRKPNVLVLDTNLKALENPGGQRAVFARPGFEKETADRRFQLVSHRLGDVLAEDEYRVIDAVPRVRPRPDAERRPQHSWVDLEHARIEAAMLPQAVPEVSGTGRRRRSPAVPNLERDQVAPAWQHPQALLAGVLPQQQPFREDSSPDQTLAFLPNDDEDMLLHRVEDDRRKRGVSVFVPAPELLHRIPLEPAVGISPWGGLDLAEILELITEQAEAMDLPLYEAARKLTTVKVPRSDQGWRWHPWLGFAPYR